MCFTRKTNDTKAAWEPTPRTRDENKRSLICFTMVKNCAEIPKKLVERTVDCRRGAVDENIKQSGIVMDNQQTWSQGFDARPGYWSSGLHATDCCWPLRSDLYNISVCMKQFIEEKKIYILQSSKVFCSTNRWKTRMQFVTYNPNSSDTLDTVGQVGSSKAVADY